MDTGLTSICAILATAQGQLEWLQQLQAIEYRRAIAARRPADALLSFDILRALVANERVEAMCCYALRFETPANDEAALPSRA